MTSIEQIEEAIERLSAEEFRKVADGVAGIYDQRWVEQMKTDMDSGRLDFLIEEARSGNLKQWP